MNKCVICEGSGAPLYPTHLPLDRRVMTFFVCIDCLRAGWIILQFDGLPGIVERERVADLLAQDIGKKRTNPWFYAVLLESEKYSKIVADLLEQHPEVSVRVDEYLHRGEK